MPYSIQTKDGIVINNIPDNIPQDAPELKQRVSTLRAANERNAKLDNPDPTEGMGGFEKLAASTGAGIEDVWLGAKQRLYDTVGTLQQQDNVRQEIEAKRARDERLFNATKGGRIAQAVGQALPLLVLPGGAAGAIGRTVAGAAAGAASGALQPTLGDESATKNAVVGGVLGGALPGALGVWNAVRNRLTRAGGEEAAGAALAERVGQQGAAPGERVAQGQAQAAAASLADQLDQRGANIVTSQGARNIPLSAAQATGDRALTEAEILNRMKFKGAWNQFDTDQMRAIVDNIRHATSGADELPNLIASRRAAYSTARQGVEQGIDPVAFSTARAELRQNLDHMLRTPEGLQPGVRQTLQDFANRMDELGDQFAPGHLMELRAQLAGKANPGMAAVTPGAAVRRDLPAVIRLKQRLDNALDQSSGGAWTDTVVAPYRQASEGVRAAQAAQTVRDRFINPETNLAVGRAADAVGEVPLVTRHGLSNAIDAVQNARTSQTMLRPEAHAVLQDTLEALRRKENLANVQLSGTGGFGSTTAGNAVQLMQDQAMREGVSSLFGHGMVGKAVGAAGTAIRNAGNLRQGAAELAALQSPEQMATLMRQAAQQLGRPLTPAEQNSLMAQIMGGAENIARQVGRTGASVGMAQYPARP